MSGKVQQEACSILCKALKHSQHSLAAAAAAALGHAGLRGPLPLPQGLSAPHKGTSSSDDSGSSTSPDAKRAKSPPQEAGKPAASAQATATTANAASVINGTSAAAAAASPSESQNTEATLQGALQQIVALTKDKDVKVAQRAATAAGHLCAGQPVRAVLDPALEGLFALGFIKNEDVLFTAGEALCFAFGGKCTQAYLFVLYIGKL